MDYKLIIQNEINRLIKISENMGKKNPEQVRKNSETILLLANNIKTYPRD